MYIHGNKTGGVGKVYTYRSAITKQVTTFRAQRGLVRVVCERAVPGVLGTKTFDGGVSVLAVRDLLQRAQALNFECSRHITPIPQELRDKLRLVENMVAVAREAQRQGDPLGKHANEIAIGKKLPGRILVGDVAWARHTGPGPIPQAPTTVPAVDISTI